MKKPKILFFDIETSPNLAYVWGKYQQDVIAYEAESEMISFAYKWLGDPKVICETKQYDKTDKELVSKLAKILQEADLIVAHNGDQFDLKKTRTRMLFHGHDVLGPVTTIDTLKIAKRYFKFNSNRLDDLGKYLAVGRKVKHTGFDLWLGCLKGKPDSWKLLAKYNKQDVLLLERVYLKMLPWIERHPSIAAFSDRENCPNCGSSKIIKDGVRLSTRNLHQKWLCKSCGSKFTKGIIK